MDLRIKDLSELAGAANKLKDFDPSAAFYVFEGQMGAGKTTFIKEFCKVLGVDDVVSSPTFSIVNVYKGIAGEIFHFDFYRIKSLEEAYDIGYEEYFYGNGVCLIEWAERVKPLLPEHYVEVKIEVLSETERLLSFSKI